MKKRILTSLLSLCLIVGLLPTAALAADESGTEGEALAVCTCTALCAEGAVDETCPVCAEDDTLCAYTEELAPADEGEPAPCTVTEACTLENGHEGECATISNELKEPADEAVNLSNGDKNNYYGTNEVTNPAESLVDMPFIVETDQSEGTVGYEITEETVEEYTHPWPNTKKDITVYILKITSAGCYTIQQKDVDTAVTNWRIEVAVDSGTVELVLSGLNIDLHKTGVHTGNAKSKGCAAISITGMCNTIITLSDNSSNTLFSGAMHAGLENNTYPVTIQCETAKENRFHDCEQDGACGSLTAKAEDNAAGIGGGVGEGANITISGGRITATGASGAGIGGGVAATAASNVSGHDITILGGYITAKAGGSSAGIGGGFNYSNGADGYNISISGGTVIAQVTAGNYSAGIGGGHKGNGENITITGGNVEAVGGTGAGIGGGGGGSGEQITITGGTVSATSAEQGAGIGGGQKGTGSNIVISGGNVSASSKKNGAGIGGGGSWDAEVGGAENIQITTPANVTVSSNTGVDIGGGSTTGSYSGGNADNILITTPVTTENDSPITVGSGSGSGVNKGEEKSIVYVDDTNTVHVITSNGEKISVSPVNSDESILIDQDGQLIIPSGGANVKTGEDETGKTLSAGSIDHSTGSITIPAGGTYGDTTYPNGATVDKNGAVKNNAILTLSQRSGMVYSGGRTSTFTYSYDGDGTVTARSSDESKATVAVDQIAKRITVTGRSAAGSVTITVSAAATENYNAASAEYSLTVQMYSGGSSYDPTYTVSTNSAENGTVSVSPRNASKGTTLTITVTPDKGYQLDTLTVTDKDGDKIKLTDKGNGKYTFKMPASKVTVKVVFAEIGEQPEIRFTDVPAGAYYADAVDWAVENGVTKGISDTVFGPDLSCTRAQMVTFLWRAAGSPVVNDVMSFTDVPADTYYADAVRWAVSKGITSGTSATTFAPDMTVTRSQTVTFLYRAAGTPAVSGGSFADVPADAYYADAVAWAVREGVTSGISATTFSPNADCTRGQIVTFMYRNTMN